MGKKIALVIGNGNYSQSAPLRNPKNDAEAIAVVLRKLGFKVLSGLDLKRDLMEDKLSEFENSISDADVAMIYYAGHGLQVNGQNYLIPVDADIRQEIHLKRRAFSLDELLQIMARRARSNLIFLDACRDNPFSRTLLSGMNAGTRSAFAVRSGLAEVKVSRGSFIAFATAPDNVASDGDGVNSPFTEALLANIETPNVSISDLMIRVRNQVLNSTDSRQEPWDQSSLRERFCFKEQTDAAPEIIEPPDRPLPVPPRNGFDSKISVVILGLIIFTMGVGFSIWRQRTLQDENTELRAKNLVGKTQSAQQSDSRTDIRASASDKTAKISALTKNFEATNIRYELNPTSTSSIDIISAVLKFSTSSDVLRIRYSQRIKSSSDFSNSERFSMIVELPLKSTYITGPTKTKDAYSIMIYCLYGSPSCIQYSNISGKCITAACDKTDPSNFVIWSNNSDDASMFRQNFEKLKDAIKD